MSRRPRLALLTLAWVACTSDPAGVATDTDTDDTTGTPTPDRCAEASASHGQHLCEQDVPDLAAWSTLSLPVDLVDPAGDTCACQLLAADPARTADLFAPGLRGLTLGLRRARL